MALIEIAEEIFSHRLNEELTIMEESKLVASGLSSAKVQES